MPCLPRARTTRTALELRAIAARLGKKEPALADLAKYQKDVQGQIPALPGRRRRGGTRRRGRRRNPGPGGRLKKSPATPTWYRRRPRLRDRLEGRSTKTTTTKAVLKARSLALLEEGPRRRPDFAHAGRLPDLDPLRDARVRQAARSRTPRTAVRRRLVDRVRFEAVTHDALDPAEHLRARPGAGCPGLPPGRLVGRAGPRPRARRLSASVWHRPLVRPTRRTGWPSARPGRGGPAASRAKRRRSGPSCGTRRPAACGASSSTGLTRWAPMRN